MKLWDLSIKKPVTVFMGMICLLVLGFISMQKLKLAFLPNVDFPGLFILVSYPNQNPEILEREVTQPLEEAISQLQGVQKVQSTTEADQVFLRVRFDWGTEIDLLRLELGLKIEEVRPDLPEGIRQIQIFSFNTNDIPILAGRISAPGIDLSENYDLLEKHIKQRLERIPGVGQVQLGGVEPKEVSIEMRLDDINEHDVDVGSIINKLSLDNLNLSSGKLKANGLVYNVRSQGRIDNIDAFGETIINKQGLRLKDIADIYYEEPPIGYRRHLDGDKALALDIRRESTANTVEVCREINRVINEEIANDPVLKGITLLVWQDQGEDIENGLNGMTDAGLYGALFAVLVLFIFLRRIKPTLIVASAIPISVVGSFIFLWGFGYTLNILTMMGIMLAVGMLVDNAVVVLENIYQKHQEGLEVIDAVREGTREVMVALIAATSTTIIVFLSLVIADKNELSIWLQAIGVTIALTLVTSLLVSTTVIPMFASKILTDKDRYKGTGSHEDLLLVRGYTWLLDFSLRHRVITAVAIIAVCAGGFISYRHLGQFHGSAIKTDSLRFDYEFNDFFFLSDAVRAVEPMEAFLDTKRDEWGIDTVYSYMQEGYAATTINFTDGNMPTERFQEIRRELREQMPAIPGTSIRFNDDEEQGNKVIMVNLFGTETSILRETGDRVADVMRSVEGLYDVRAGENSGKKELQVSVDRKQANLYGISPQQISEIFGFTLGSRYMPRFQHENGETDVVFGLRIEDRATINDLSQLRIAGGVPLGSVAKFEFVDSESEIRRVDRKANYRVRGTFEGDNYEATLKEIEGILNEMELPAGVTWSWSDRILRDRDDMSSLFTSLFIALLLVYLILASLFENILQPLMILSTIIFAVVGSGYFLLITQTEFHVMSGIGLMILIGIAVNNGIIMMDRINQLHRGAGMALRQAVREGARQRIRPIMMTASTTIIGLIPMAIGSSGLGDAYYFPLARTVIGGLASSTVLTLVGLPAIILFWEDFKSFLGWLVRGRRKAEIEYEGRDEDDMDYDLELGQQGTA
jgi:HAE1 family hydrophobic/amphiphilic exporter-1